MKLTELASCAGCAAKMDSATLAAMLRALPPITDPNVLVGNATSDDAGVYRVSDELALVQTVDFFTPIVDDPYDFGAIAATNAISDVYAMGGKPLSALAIGAFPEKMDPAIAGAILRGGADAAKRAGIEIIGGHTIKDDEPKYGLAVTGVVHPGCIVRNSTARAGDEIFLTKALGTGILTTARRRGAIRDADLQPAIDSMKLLNREASVAMLRASASAATDVTGFGLAGHLREMTASAGIGAVLHSSQFPLLAHARDLAVSCAPGGTLRNLEIALENDTRFAADLDDAMRILCCDAQTSGGLLVAIPRERASDFVRAANEEGVSVVAHVGTFTETPGITIA